MLIKIIENITLAGVIFMRIKYRAFTLVLLLVFIIVAVGAINPSSKVQASSEVKAVWISYLDFGEMGLKDKSEADFRKKTSALYDGIIKNNLNTVYVQVRTFNDAIYPSENFEWSEYITSNKNGPGYDPLKIMIEIAHQKGIRFEAWMNPYRISSKSDRTSYVKSTSSPGELSRMIEYTSSAGQTCLVWDPASADARNLIVSETGNIVKNYNVDGVHFDDYFYQSAYFGNTTTAEREKNVNDLIKSVYSKIKSIKSNAKFGISTSGNVNACLEDGADVKTWLANPGYIDYICPQLYWSDSYGASGNTQLYSNCLNDFLSINKNGTDMYVGLALYKVAEKPSVNVDSGWTNSNQNLAKQAEIAEIKGVKGYALFSARYLSYPSTQGELNSLNKAARLTGWVCLNNTWYYFQNGTMVKNGWALDSRGWCFLNAIDGSWVKEGWALDSHGWCYIQNGYWANHSMWARDSSGWMHIGDNGYWDGKPGVSEIPVR